MARERQTIMIETSSGGVPPDLTEYVKWDDLNNTLTNYVTKIELETALENPIPFIVKPSIISPSDNASNVTELTIESSTFALYDIARGEHTGSDWQIATDSEFTNIVDYTVNDPDNLTTWFPGGLQSNTVYFVRVKYISDQLTSVWSDVISFTTGSIVTLSQPILTLQKNNGKLLIEPVATLSGFSSNGPDDTLVAVEWIIRQNGKRVWKKIIEGNNLLEIILPGDILGSNTTNDISVRFISQQAKSQYTTVTETTITSKVYSTWSPFTSYPYAGRWGIGSLNKNNDIFIAGTESEKRFVSLDSINDNWVIEPNMIFNARDHGASALLNGNILVTGGVGTGNNRQHYSIFNINSDAWTDMGLMPTDRYEHGQITLNDGRVLLIGGYDTNGRTSRVDIYDPYSDTWSSGSSLPELKRRFGITKLLNGDVIVCGGRNRTTRVGSTFRYRVDSDSWARLPDLPYVAEYLRVITGDDGNVYALGGRNGSTYYSYVYSYDVNLDIWKLVSTMPIALAYHFVVKESDGTILVGCGRNSSLRNNVYKFF